MKFLIKILKNTAKFFYFCFWRCFCCCGCNFYCSRGNLYKYVFYNKDAEIINNYDFNGLILGTSMLENTLAKEAAKYLTQKKS